MSAVENLEPNLLWKYFDEICKIPRCSKHEDRIRDYLLDFAKKQNLKYKTDNPGNVVITKPASHGMESKPILILQSHMDMVCEKNSDVKHDFSKDPIKLKLKGDVLTADGTTLGADDGIGIATSMAILDDKSLKHGPIEALFTVDEETGLTGAFALKSDMLSGKIMLNIDSEDFGVLTIGCAGGGDTKIKLPISKKPIEKDMESFLIKISGLRGGHSGVDIHEQRANAIKLLTRLLWKTYQNNAFCLFEIKGGDKHNAIPRESYAKIAIESENKSKLISDLKSEEKVILGEIKPIDPGFKISIESIEIPNKVLSKESQMKLLNLLHSLPHGIDKMSYDIPDLVETSTNLATVSFDENNILVSMSSRSSIMSALQDYRDRIKAIALLSGAEVTENTPYPGWKPNLESNILALSKKIFKEMYKKAPKVEAIHAGLECGIIGEKFPGMDMISLGPTIRYPHSPEEQVEVSTVSKFYDYLIELILNV